MAEHVQALIDKIRTEAVDEAKRQAAVLLSDAAREAEEIKKKALLEADVLIAEAKKNADSEILRGKAALERASRDVILSIGFRTQKLMETWLIDDVAAALPASAITGFLTHFLKNNPSGPLEISVSEALKEQVEQGLKKTLKDHAAGSILVKSNPSLKGGCTIRYTEERVELDFSAESIAESLAFLVRPALAETIRNAVSGVK